MIAQSPGTSTVDPAVQLQDIRLLEMNIRKSVESLQQLRRRYLGVCGLLVASSAFWTWRLRAALAGTPPKGALEATRLYLAWALLGVAPLVLFFGAGIYRATIVEPSLFVDRLNRSLAQFHVAYAADSGRLLRTDPAPAPAPPPRAPIWARARAPRP